MKTILLRKNVCCVGLVLIATALFTTPEIQAQVTQITVTGAGKGANAYRAMAAIAEAVNQNSKTVQATNRESGGFVEGTRLVAANRVQIAMSSGPFVDFWQRKINPFDRDTGAPRHPARHGAPWRRPPPDRGSEGQRHQDLYGPQGQAREPGSEGEQFLLDDRVCPEGGRHPGYGPQRTA